MQRQASLQDIIGTYRLVFAGVAALVVITGAIALLGYFTDPRAIEMVVVRVLAGASLLLLLRWGYVRLKQELKRAAEEQRQLLDLAYRDALTGAHTRSYFFSALTESLRADDRPVAYLQIDMDNLKVLNDSHGHAAGDAALVHLVKTLKALLPDALVGRLGCLLITSTHSSTVGMST